MRWVCLVFLGMKGAAGSITVSERLMGGDPWVQDPVGIHLPGYRDRYYEVGLGW
jgi:hypothetical protein